MKPSDKVKFGRAGFEVTAFAFGTAPIGNFMRGIDEKTADAMGQRVWDGGVRFYDTALCTATVFQNCGPGRPCTGKTGTILCWRRRGGAS